MNQNVMLIIVLCVALLFIVFLAWTLLQKKRPRKEKIPYVEALNALVEDDKRTALQKLREAVRIDSQNIDAYLKLGRLLRDEGDAERALKIHKSLTVRPLSQAQHLEVLKALALDYVAARKYSQAKEHLEEILSRDKKEIWALETLSRMSEETGQWETAFETRKRILRVQGQEDKHLLALYKVYAGLALDEQDEHHKARLKYKEALRIDENCTPAYLYLGDSYFSEKRLNDAVTYWKKLITVIPEHAYLCFDRLEKAHFELGDFSTMAQLYQTLVDKKPDDLLSLFALVNIKEKMGELDEAIKLCQQALERDPESSEARWCLVKYYHAKGDDGRSIEYALELEKSARRKSIFHCNNCGYEAKEPLWRCPQCKSWRSFL